MFTEQELGQIASYLQRIKIKPAEIPTWQGLMMKLGQAAAVAQKRAMAEAVLQEESQEDHS